MAHKRETDHANGLEDAWTGDGVAFGRVAFEFGGYGGAFDEDGENDDDHADEREARRPRELVDVAVERERVRDADGAESDHELTIGEEGKYGDSVEGGEY